MARHFFFYGTLRHDIAQGHARTLIEGLEIVGAGTVAARLFAKRDPRGTYPVLVRGAGSVHGVVCRAGVGFSACARAAMDRYEGSEYIRRAVRVRLEGGGSLTADAYFYNRPITAALMRIANGDFAHFLAVTGDPAFA